MAHKMSVRHSQDNKIFVHVQKEGTSVQFPLTGCLGSQTHSWHKWLQTEDWEMLIGLSQQGPIHGAGDEVSFSLKNKGNAWRCIRFTHSEKKDALVWVAVTEYHSLSDNNHLFLTVLEARNVRSECRYGWVFGEGSHPALSSFSGSV